MNSFDTYYAPKTHARKYDAQTLSHCCKETSINNLPDYRIIEKVNASASVLGKDIEMSEESGQSEEADISQNVFYYINALKLLSVSTIHDDFNLGELALPKTQVKPLESHINDGAFVQSYNPKPSSSCKVFPI
jgi:predicted signal transduction protein with EAL and GGDEF domain